jgi:hypothetical protein
MEDDYKNDHCFNTGCCFVKSGLWFFIIGVILGFGVLLHYIVGSSYDTSQQFLSNVTLWFGSPLTLSVSFLQVGGLAMAILGILHCWKAKCHTHCVETSNTTTSNVGAPCPSCCTGSKTALTLCYIGMIALVITGYIGYFTIDWIWPGFYYLPIMIGKNVWLVLQGLSILIFLVGFIMATCCCCCKHKRDTYTQR